MNTDNIMNVIDFLSISNKARVIMALNMEELLEIYPNSIMSPEKFKLYKQKEEYKQKLLGGWKPNPWTLNGFDLKMQDMIELEHYEEYRFVPHALFYLV